MLLERLKKILGWEFSHTRGSSSFQFVHEAGRGRSFLVLHSLLSSTTIIRRDCVAEELIHGETLWRDVESFPDPTFLDHGLLFQAAI